MSRNLNPRQFNDGGRGSHGCLLCGHSVDLDRDGHVWWDDNEHAELTDRAAIVHNTWEDCRRAQDTARNLRGERSRPDHDA